MDSTIHSDWKKKIVTPEDVFEELKPGHNIFLSTGMAAPRTLVKRLMQTRSNKIQDLELLQLGSFGDAIVTTSNIDKHRLKTFFSGWVKEQTLRLDRMDLIPCRPSRIPALIESRQIPIDAAFIQITPPNPSGYCSLGCSVDVAQLAMEQASLTVGEINSQLPQTFGDTFIHLKEFDMFIESTEAVEYTPRPVVDETNDRLAANVASVIEDGSCIGFSIGELFEALSRHLTNRKHLGVHSPFFTDALKDLVESGAVSNRRKANWRGRCVASYAYGTKELMEWLDRNPLVEFQRIDKVFDSLTIGKNSKFITVVRASKVDLTGQVALPYLGMGAIGLVLDFFNGAGLSPGGRKLIALSSRNKDGTPNICLSVEGFHNQLSLRETVDMIITEYGVANLYGRTVRERAQALIDIAHPDDRQLLVEEAKKAEIIHSDQIFLKESARYPYHIQDKYILKNGTEIRFRAIRPSDEDKMRHHFYQFSDKAVYSRYFVPIVSMPHTKMQEYVNIDYNRIMSIAALEGDVGSEKIIAEGRYARLPDSTFAAVAFTVNESYHNLGIASHLMQMLIQIAKEQGITGFTADILRTNLAMIKVFDKCGLKMEKEMERGVLSVTMPFH